MHSSSSACAKSTAVYGGEMSAHHYFRRFAYCDSGMIPWLLVAQILSESGKPLSKLVGERIAQFPASGELNYRVPDAKAAIAAIESRYARHGARGRPHRRHLVRIRATGGSICAPRTPSR